MKNIDEHFKDWCGNTFDTGSISLKLYEQILSFAQYYNDQKIIEYKSEALEEYLVDPKEFIIYNQEHKWEDTIPDNFMNKGWVKLAKSMYKSKDGSIKEGIYDHDRSCYLAPRDDIYLR